MAFTGFPDEMVDFYEGLTADNSKAFWTAHRETYESAVRAPMEAMLAELAGLPDGFGRMKFFRPYRDVRFSHDKSPYKTAAAAVASGPGGPTGLYVQVSADGLVVAGGYYGMAADQVERYRRAVVYDRSGARLEALLAELVGDGFGVHGEELKRPPRGYGADAPRLALLRRKNLHAGRSWPYDDVLASAAAVDRVATAWRRLGPLNDWLERHVGAVRRSTGRPPMTAGDGEETSSRPRGAGPARASAEGPVAGADGFRPHEGQPSPEMHGVGEVPGEVTDREIRRDAASIGVAVGVYGLSYGAAAVTAGLSVLQTCALSTMAFTGASQFALVGVLGSGGAPMSGAATALLLGVRNGLYGVRLSGLLGYRSRHRPIAAQFVIDETTAMATSHTDRRRARLAFVATAVAVYSMWNLATILGATAAGLVGDPASLGLDAAFPAAFLALLWPRLEDRTTRAVALGGAAVALVTTPFLPVGVPVLLAALVALVGIRG